MAFGSIWKFGADNSEYKKAVREMPSELDKSARQIESRTKEMGSKMSGAMREFSSILAGGMALAGLKSLMNDFDQVAKVATRFGASAEEIQRVSVAADLAGTSIDTVARVLTKMSVAASDATSGNKAMAESFAKAGINAEQFKNSGLDQQLVILSEAFNRARGDADATNQIIELMGTRAASQMIPLIDNTAALRSEMEGVSVASDDVVRKIEAANDRLTRLGNDVKVVFANLLQSFTDTSERIGTILAQGDGLFRLIDGLANASRGNFLPLFQVLATGRTIAEMDQIQARANAIAQLTNEGLLNGSDAENAALIAERTKQILDQMRGIGGQIQIAEDLTQNVLAVEKEKTAELEKQAAVLARQQEQREQAIKSIMAEVALIEAQLSGDKAREESLREQADFQRAFDKTGSTEAAANFAAAKAAERAARPSQPSVGASGGGLTGGASSPKTALQLLEEAARIDPRARAALMRLRGAQDRTMNRADRLEQAGQINTAARVQIEAERKAEEAAARELERQLMDRLYGARNAGNAMRNFEKEARAAGMTPREALDRMGYTPRDGESMTEALKRFIKDAAKSEQQRQQEGDTSFGQGDPMKPKDQAFGLESTLQQCLAALQNLDKKLPQNALS